MRITCPTCASSYQVSDRALGAGGRKVRCARCGNTWHARANAIPPDEMVAEAEWEAVEQAEVPQSAARADEDADWKRALAGDDPPATASQDSINDLFGDGGGSAAASQGSIDDLFGGGGGASNSQDSIDDLFGGSGAPSGGGSSQAAVDGLFDPGDVGSPAGAGDGEPDDPLSAAGGASSSDAAYREDPPPRQRPRNPVIDDEPAGFAQPPRRRAATRFSRISGVLGTAQARMARMATVVGASVLLLGIIAGGLFARETVVRLLPDLAALYSAVGLEVNLRGLEFREVRTFREREGGSAVLVVEGEIVSVSATERPVPTIRFALRSTAGREVYAWTMSPGKSVLASGESLSFRSRLPAPPEAAADVLVRFTDRSGS